MYSSVSPVLPAFLQKSTMKTGPAILVVLVAAFSCAQSATYTLIQNADCPGHDIQNVYGIGGGLFSCKGLCDNRGDCKSFQYNNNNGNCFLKNYACNTGELVGNQNGNLLNKEGPMIYWMQDLNDNDKMRELAIPGSHDTAAYRIRGDLGECHDWDIQQQLSGGIRFFDIRISNGGGDNDFELRHGNLQLGSFRHKVMNIVANFLSQRASETVFMSIKPESSFDVDRMESLFVQNSFYRFYQGLVTANTKLSEVRGKIVLIKRYGQTSYSNSIGINWDQLHVQDEYQLSGSIFGVNYDRKAEIVTNHFEAAAVSTNGKIWVNFASANWNGLKIGNNAEVSNAAVKNFYDGTNQRVGSIVPMDYPNRSAGVIQAIIDNNLI